MSPIQQDIEHSDKNKPAPIGDGTMKAVRFHGQEDLRYEDIAEPVCGKGQIKVRLASHRS